MRSSIPLVKIYNNEGFGFDPVFVWVAGCPVWCGVGIGVGFGISVGACVLLHKQEGK